MLFKFQTKNTPVLSQHTPTPQAETEGRRTLLSFRGLGLKHIANDTIHLQNTFDPVDIDLSFNQLSVFTAAIALQSVRAPLRGLNLSHNNLRSLNLQRSVERPFDIASINSSSAAVSPRMARRTSGVGLSGELRI